MTNIANPQSTAISYHASGSMLFPLFLPTQFRMSALFFLPRRRPVTQLATTAAIRYLGVRSSRSESQGYDHFSAPAPWRQNPCRQHQECHLQN